MLLSIYYVRHFVCEQVNCEIVCFVHVKVQRKGHEGEQGGMYKLCITDY